MKINGPIKCKYIVFSPKIPLSIKRLVVVFVGTSGDDGFGIYPALVKLMELTKSPIVLVTQSNSYISNLTSITRSPLKSDINVQVGGTKNSQMLWASWDNSNAYGGAIQIREYGNVNNTQSDWYRDWETDRKSTRLNSSHSAKSRMPSSA